ncbi:hypothetical protein RD792_015847 [Penstemon davidsonii]|uniref:2-(3-amino-3-carboxypropyl)histidine synthase subunit 1 n=1 Tax=Penstemon davidsonii TaxID=160366 RepID=A0ABR0CIP8_9LAMI|nr:hypothetical protein RD792_015847 [Penstemon davidsonii]
MSVEKVVLIQTNIDVNWSGIKWLLRHALSDGDELVLVGLVHLINHPTLSLHTILGYKGKEDKNKIFGSTRKDHVEDQLKRRKEDFQKNPAIIQLQKLYEKEKKVQLNVEVEAGSSRKVAAFRAAKRLGATWIILDREMKKDKQYFMDRLSCKISSMKSNNTVVQIRGPINEHVTYEEMIPSYSWEEDLSPSPKSPVAQGTISTKDYYYSTRPSQIIASTSSFITTHTQHTQEHQVEFENSVCSVCKNKRPQTAWQRDFTYEELHEATKGFSRDNFLSEGGFGFVFKGILKDGLQIAVKQHKAASLQGEKEFRSEVCLLSQARHQNLVMLLGSCTQGSHRLLVYEYVCNGSLEQHLSSDENTLLPLNWENRIKIALGAAKGLKFLHQNNIVHRDMRPANILVTHDHESLLGDFGLAKAQQDDDTNTIHSSSDNGVVGTLGYVAPEYAETGKMSTKTDVYSFGVVLLQLITGLRTPDEIPEGKSFIGWAKPLLETKNYPDLIDKRIVDSHDVLQLFWMVRVAEQCLKEDPDNRCTMEQFPDEVLKDSMMVVKALRRELNSGVKLYVMADTTYGSCCVDEVGAAHVNAQCVIHYGHTCLSPTSSLPALFIFGKASISATNCARNLLHYGVESQKPVLVLFGLEYAHAIPEIKEIFACNITKICESTSMPEPLYADVSGSVMSPAEASTAANQLGLVDSHVVIESLAEGTSKNYKIGGLSWRLPKGHKVEDYLLFWIGLDNPAFVNVVLTFNSCEIVRYDATKDCLITEVSQHKKILKRRYFLVEKAKDANMIGILVGTLGAAGYLHIIHQMKELITRAGKKSYTFVMGRPNPAKLANFPECDVFINVSCAQTALLDSKEFLAPIITPFEAMLALDRGSQWTGEYVLEFQDLIASTSIERELSEEARFSFFEGGYVEDLNLRENNEVENGVAALVNITEKALKVRDDDSLQSVTKSIAKSGAEYFAGRSYHGLEINGTNSHPDKFLTGRSGKASGYKDEMENGGIPQ